MKQIRKNIFETNSSSSHSLVISNKDRGYDYNLPIDENGILTIRFGEYGWGPELLRTPYEKLCYWFTDHVPGNITYKWEKDLDNEKFFKDSIQELSNKGSNNHECGFKYAIDLLKKRFPQLKQIVFEPVDGSYQAYYMFGYLDHESVGSSTEVEFEELVFNSNVLVIVDNDNSEYFYDYLPREWGEIPAKLDKEELFETNDPDFYSKLVNRSNERYELYEQQWEIKKEIREICHDCTIPGCNTCLQKEKVDKLNRKLEEINSKL